VLVPVVQVGHVRVGVNQRLVGVPVRVAFGDRLLVMAVPVVLVVLVLVLVDDRGVGVLVLVA
jgi:hypothetical protein